VIFGNHNCHSIVHWNLPRGAVELEQREGRISRYKSHSVRRAVARELGLAALNASADLSADPWSALFERGRLGERSSLAPFWEFQSKTVGLERQVPAWPCSREIEGWRALLKQRAVYRVVLGQPDANDLAEGLITADEP
jgi:hypothetical protein